MTRVAVITGAAGGIGSAICRLLASRLWSVIPVDRREVDHPEAIQVDMADGDEILDRLSALPRVDALVNNAAMQLYKPLVDTTLEEWDSIAAVNLRAAFVCIKAVQRQLSASHGAVVNVGSVHAVSTSQSISAYAATKGGLLAFTRAAALEFAPFGVRVNSVLPGAIDTPALRAGFGRRQNAEASLIAQTPLQRLGAPDEVAEAVEFLLDRSRSGFITGTALTIDGGALARLSTE